MVLRITRENEVLLDSDLPSYSRHPYRLSTPERHEALFGLANLRDDANRTNNPSEPVERFSRALTSNQVSERYSEIDR
jgi:hypothetical protein